MIANTRKSRGMIIIFLYYTTLTRNEPNFIFEYNAMQWTSVACTSVSPAGGKRRHQAPHELAVLAYSSSNIPASIVFIDSKSLPSSVLAVLNADRCVHADPLREKLSISASLSSWSMRRSSSSNVLMFLGNVLTLNRRWRWNSCCIVLSCWFLYSTNQIKSNRMKILLSGTRVVVLKSAFTQPLKTQIYDIL